MTSLLHPGVYVREIPGGARSIEGVPTGTAIFVGETERGPIGPTKINGRSQYKRIFGGYLRVRDGGPPPTTTRLLMPYAMDGYFSNGGTSAYVLRAMDGVPTAADFQDGGNAIIQASSPGIWANGAVQLTLTDSSDGDANRFRIVVFYTAPGTPGATLEEDWDRLSIASNDTSYVVDVLRRSRFIRWNGQPAAIPTLTAVADPTEANLLTAATPMANGVGGGGVLSANPGYTDLLTNRLAEIDDAALLVAASDRMLPPDFNTSDNDFVLFENDFINYVRNGRPEKNDLFFVGNLPRLTADPTVAVTAAVNHARANTVTGTAPSDYNAVYWPWIERSDPVGAGQNPTITIPPSGYVAGLYARTDARRGVWKAPAGTEVQIGEIRGLDFNVLDRDQDNLNPQGINALRTIPGSGMVVWGARTRLVNSEYRYVSVRRTAMFLRKSIFNGIQWAVFEPNDEPLWQSLRNTIRAFMETQFRNGAFAGATSNEAYFVKVDAETTTPDDQAAGIVNIQVGFAPLRPAEFVVVTLQQMAGQQSA